METKRIYIKDTEHVRDEELLEAAEIIRRICFEENEK